MRRKTFLFALLFFWLVGITSYSQTKTVYMVADAHLDTQWEWDVKTTIEQYLPNTLNENFALFEKYPDYKFNFEGAIKYMWFKEYYPEKYERLKGYVASGQWNVTGSSLDASDLLVPSIESRIRNILIGQTFYNREFGVKSNDIFLPDCFGFGYTLPTIMNHCGLIGFSTQKLSWGGITTPSDSRISAWQGVDGSKILAAAEAGSYSAGFNEDMSYNQELLDWANTTGTLTGDKHYIAYRYYGVGDRGGAIDDNTVEWLERSINSDGPLTVRSATAGELYDDYFPFIEDFPVYDGELVMTTHGTGCYTSRTMLKRWNRKNELMADATEKSAVMADWFGGLTYPKEDLNDAWIKILWHQFHDDLTGTSIPEAYEYTYNDEVLVQNMLANILTNAVGAGSRSLDTQTEGTPVVVYNPLSITRNDIVEVNLDAFGNSAYFRVYDKNGVEVPAQVIETGDESVKLIFNASVPSMGYEVYDVRSSDTAPDVSSELEITENSLENPVYKVSIDGNGDISSIIDKQNGNRELLSSPIRLALFDNFSNFWPSWEITYETVNSQPRGYVDGPAKISIEEAGPVRVTLKIERVKENSTFVQYVRLTNSDTQRRIDIENDVNWKTTKTLLKAVFPFTVNNPQATYDLGLGVIQRSNNTRNLYEVPAQQWADITNSDNSYGVSVLNDCKYGWDKPSDNTLRLSLIHTPAVTDRYIFQKNQDLGNNKFTYSIFGHPDSWKEAESSWAAAKLNQQLMAFETVKHAGDQGKSFSFLNVQSSQVALKALKQAEESNEYVLRFHETQGEPATNVNVEFASEIISAKEVNGIEEEIGNASFSGNVLTISMNAFQPKAYSVTLASPDVMLTNPESQPLTLPYNDDVITSQDNMSDGDFDGLTNSYAAELVPDMVVSEGVEFSIGPKTDGQDNVLRCAGDRITIPSGYDKLYVLAASSNMDGTTDDFYVDDVPYTLDVSYYSNFLGQASAYHIISGDTIVEPNYFNKENVAWTGTHLHNGETLSNKVYEFSYMFKYCIHLPENANELILPENSDIAVFAITAANNSNDDTKAASELRDIQKPDEVESYEPEYCGDNISQSKSVSASGQIGDHERAELAVDGDESTKWCHVDQSDKWLVVDLGEYKEICQWKVIHAGVESPGYITSDFKLQRFENDRWIDVDEVNGNYLNTTYRDVDPFVAKKVRLYISDSGSDDAARIYEFMVFGKVATNMADVTSEGEESLIVFPNPVSSNSFSVELIGFENESEVDITVTNVAGVEVFKERRKYGRMLDLTLSNALKGGLHFIGVKGENSKVEGKFIVSK